MSFDFIEKIVCSLLAVLIPIWLLVTFISTIFGLVESQLSNSHCSKPKVRIEYVVPGFAIGCWLGSVPQ